MSPAGFAFGITASRIGFSELITPCRFAYRKTPDRNALMCRSVVLVKSFAWAIGLQNPLAIRRSEIAERDLSVRPQVAPSTCSGNRDRC